jgi:outer membrane lipoprotein-sorting protein
MRLLLLALSDNVPRRPAFSGRRWAVAAIALSACTCGTAAQGLDSRQTTSNAPSCSLPGLAADTGGAATADKLLAAYNAQAALIHSLRAYVILRGEGVGAPGPTEYNSRPIPTTVLFQAPTFLRMTGVIPFSARRVFDMASDSRQFRLLVQEGNGMRMIVGPVDAPETSTNFKENIRPQMALEAIRFLPADLRSSGVPEPAKDAQSKTIGVELQTSSGKRLPAQLEFDMSKGTLARLIISDPSGKQASEVDYSDWQKTAEPGKPDSQACFPRRIFVTQPDQNRKIEMKFMSIQLNVPVLPSQFQFVPPPGTTVTRVGAGPGTRDAKP